MNLVACIGNLTKDPELKTTPNGKSVCRFTVAVNGIRKKNSNDEPRVDYVPCVAWDTAAENLAKYCKKGRMLAIKGSLKSGKYEKDGKTVFTLEVEVDKYDGLRFLSDSKRNNGESTADQMEMAVDEQSGFTAVETDELPF